ncbi:glycosyltransferase family 9 protein [Microbacterium trichothecenolyticum]|uniref:ADP-heptose:LPS heptosyltransferase n=1 Tax=Microbacterium trichothecenolyticum TaxID=69370 RepID=A0ABU0TSG6_MICTR|nr:glycosyltransferase family 9 protein [Microbacterium trichothecenolyticum]MDQ1122616.1 ADP-heptose:LPS heptosyltransferase [Microbacterium trichothecenolyticum]
MDATLPSGAQRFDDVLKIAVLRGGGLGDLLFALPAVEALSRTYPEAEIVLLGTPLAATLLGGRPGPVARVEALPRARGVHGPDDADDARGIGRFLQRMTAEHIDLACQMHGGGRYSNPFLLGLGARHTVGTRTPDAAPLERNLPYVYYQHETVRWREVAALAGAATAPEEPHLAVTPRERMRGFELIGERRAGLAVVHPGATDPRRRWPADRFVEVAVRLAADGMRVVVVGDGGDAAIADGIAAEAGRRAGDAVFSLAGRLSLSELAGVLATADVFVGNDSGPRHLAHAVGAPTVGIYWAGNLINGGPPTRARHRVQLSWTTRCPVCDRDVTQVGWTAERCAHDDSFVTDVTVDAVYDDAVALAAVAVTAARW